MAKFSVPYLSARPGRRDADGAPTTRYFWQPGPELRSRGWHLETLGPDQGKAIARASAINEAIAAHRRGAPVPAGMPFDGDQQPSRRRSTAIPGSVDALLHAFKASRFYLDKRPKTRKGYAWCSDIISEVYGDEPAASITAKDREDLYAPMRAKTPAKANAVVRFGRLVWNLADALGIPLARNPWEKARLIGLDKSGKPWPAAAVACAVATCDALGMPAIGDAIMLDEWIGQREGDLLRAPRKLRQELGLVFGQSKTGSAVILAIDMIAPLMVRLAAADARLAARDVKATTLIVNDATGLPYNEHTFRHDWAKIRRAMAGGPGVDEATAAKVRAIGGPWPSFEVDYVVAGRAAYADDVTTVYAKDLVIKDLRHTAVLRLADAGCDIPFICAVTGHELASAAKILSTYNRHTRRRAVLAFQKRLDHEAAAKNETA